MEGTGKDTLCRQLGTVNTALFFLLLIILGTLLSFWAVLIQRRQLECAIAGDAQAARDLPETYPIRRAASALIIGSLGFYLCLALSTAREAGAGDDQVAKRSASTNLWASLLVLVAAVIRLIDLDDVECSRQSALEEEILPGT